MNPFIIPAGHLTPMVCRYVQEKANMAQPFDPNLCGAFAIFNEKEEFIGGVVISSYTIIDCQMSVASETSLAFPPNILKAVAVYVFEQLGCVRCTSLTQRSNKKARAALEHLGFQLEGLMRKGYDGRRDALIYGLLREECRLLDADPVEPGELDPEPAPSVQ